MPQHKTIYFIKKYIIIKNKTKKMMQRKSVIILL